MKYVTTSKNYACTLHKMGTALVVGAKQPTAYSTVQTRGESENEVKSAHS